MHRRMFLIVLAALALLGPARAASADRFKVIVHPSNPVTSLSRDTISKLLLKKSTSWSNGNKALPVDQRVSSGVRDRVSRAVHGRSARAVKNWWNQQLFAGKGVPPPELASDAKVVAYVLANPGAIGYVSADAATGDAKVVAVTD